MKLIKYTSNKKYISEKLHSSQCTGHVGPITVVAIPAEAGENPNRNVGVKDQQIMGCSQESDGASLGTP